MHTLGLRGSSLLLPLRAEEDQVVGILSIADDRVKDAYAPEEIGLLETVAAQVGVTLDQHPALLAHEGARSS